MFGVSQTAIPVRPQEKTQQRMSQAQTFFTAAFKHLYYSTLDLDRIELHLYCPSSSPAALMLSFGIAFCACVMRSSCFYLSAFAGDAVDGYVARKCNQGVCVGFSFVYE